MSDTPFRNFPIPQEAPEWMRQWMEQASTPELMHDRAVKFWAVQDQIVSDLHDHFETWCTRRHAGTQAAMECAEKVTNGAEPAQVPQIMSEWAAGAMGRLAQDAQDHMQLSFRIMSDMMTAMTGTPWPGSTIDLQEADSGSQKGGSSGSGTKGAAKSGGKSRSG